MPSASPLDPVDSPAEAVSLRRLPFAYAKRHGVLVQVGADGARLVYRPGTALAAVGRRCVSSGGPWRSRRWMRRPSMPR